MLRVHEKIRANIGGIAEGIPEPLIVGRGINDVAIVVLTLVAETCQGSTAGPTTGSSRSPRNCSTSWPRSTTSAAPTSSAAPPNQIRVEPDPERLSLYGVTLNQLVDKLTQCQPHHSRSARSAKADRRSPSLAGQTLQGVPDIGLLLLTSRDGRPVYVKDVANVVVGAAEPRSRAWTMTPWRRARSTSAPAVSIALAKRKGANAVIVAKTSCSGSKS